ncbi:acyl-CoA--sterol O-acyltransferase 1-like [Salvia miltiorrhiza]|uniref:acyl-CoA--sterol O-acyltransferase 1-like n=1 Tax=Salvia miltiorrhiza TaxID=226208 RepID=UPI0025AD8B78|nr:acyl-CoA--sterol O-acyltransferase 1-like [Salvia miltiorrhiza]
MFTCHHAVGMGCILYKTIPFQILEIRLHVFDPHNQKNQMEMEGELKKVLKYWMEGEITSFVKVWLSAYLSLTYCYIAAKMFRSAAARLAAFLPVVCLLLVLPLQLHSMHLVGTTAFFLAWLATFKLLLLAFHQGPLSTPSLSLLRFLAVACLPIKLRQDDAKKKDSGKGPKSLLNYGVKGVLFGLLLKIYDYEDHIHPYVIMVLYSFHVYLSLELILATAAATARGLLGAELEPQFNEPYLSTSLQDFWGRRWNLMVTRILRPAVYLPVLGWSAGIVGRKWAPLPAVMSAFAVSGFMHELIFYYFGRVKPTWEITCFFLLHGSCLAAEIVVKKAVNGRWRLPWAVGTVLTASFVLVTGLWLFFPPMLRCKGDERGLAEVAAVGAFLKDVVRAMIITVNP